MTDKKNSISRREILKISGAAGATSFGLSVLASSATASTQNSIDYSELNPVEKRAFETGLRTEKIIIQDHIRYDNLVNNDTVRYNDSEVLLNKRWQLTQIDTINPEVVSSVAEDRNVVNYEELPEQARQIFKEAITNGKQKSSKTLLTLFNRNSHIRFEKKVYRLNLATGDHPTTEIRVL